MKAALQIQGSLKIHKNTVFSNFYYLASDKESLNTNIHQTNFDQVVYVYVVHKFINKNVCAYSEAVYSLNDRCGQLQYLMQKELKIFFEWLLVRKTTSLNIFFSIFVISFCTLIYGFILVVTKTRNQKMRSNEK